MKRALVSKMKLDLAKARAREEAEAARLAYEHRQKMELRRLEEEETLAELEWKIETQYDENTQAPGVVSPMFAPTFLVDKQPQSTPFISSPTDGSEENPTTVQPVPGVVSPIEASTCLAAKKLDSTPLNSISVSVPDEQPSKQTDTKGALHNETTAASTPASGTSKPQDSVTTQRNPPARQPDTSNPLSEMCPSWPPCVVSVQSAVGDEITPLHHIPYQGPIPSEVSITAVSDTVNVPDCVASHKDLSPWERNMSSSVKERHWPQTPQSFRVAPSRCTSGEDCAPRDPIAAMWKVQLLSGIKPTQFSGNPADFPFFQQQIQTHLESDLLTDAQRIEYLPKFVTGEALEVVKRNRGCSFKDIMKTLEERFGQAVRVTQACVEDLASGPKLAYGDNVGLMNISEKLNAASRILHGDVEREASVATNLKRIVNRRSIERYCCICKETSVYQKRPGIWDANTEMGH